MPITVYSKRFERELDAIQLANILDPEHSHTPHEAEEVLSGHAGLVSTDLECPGCGVTDAILVRGGKAAGSKKAVSQPHFRFGGTGDATTHHTLCEFHPRHEADPRDEVALVNFAKAQDGLTKSVRELVCKGIEGGVVSAADLRGMRQWFFDQRVAHRRVVRVREEQIDCLKRVAGLLAYRAFGFSPPLADLPEFDWARAVQMQMAKDCAALSEKTRQLRLRYNAFGRAQTLATRHMGEEVFDCEALRPFYGKTVDMAVMIGTSGSIALGRWKPDMHRVNGVPAHLLALCALLLFVTGWDLDEAMARYVGLVMAPPPQDLDLGNCIGLDPFHDYDAWRIVFATDALSEELPGGGDFDAAMAETEAQLRERYRQWKAKARN